ncbi:hypothetical protein GXN76_04115 [Kroppenstedtia pulmonis]|uniref:Uncharacterized protein n=1 Tax=Kroppenstedtia pulmonis TaxID=1380685 RepID=A0A7D3XI48_9BACL|nr:hypothetical protein [Kroppenstedtia pulmonis]QKG83739.1 hypothetical protein GXN76_04115 [Kroppenstedtia pulmonis]
MELHIETLDTEYILTGTKAQSVRQKIASGELFILIEEKENVKEYIPLRSILKIRIID